MQLHDLAPAPGSRKKVNVWEEDPGPVWEKHPPGVIKG